jgi:hypothetical protein
LGEVEDLGIDGCIQVMMTKLAGQFVMKTLPMKMSFDAC